MSGGGPRCSGYPAIAVAGGERKRSREILWINPNVGSAMVGDSGARLAKGE